MCLFVRISLEWFNSKWLQQWLKNKTKNQTKSLWVMNLGITSSNGFLCSTMIRGPDFFAFLMLFLSLLRLLSNHLFTWSILSPVSVRIVCFISAVGYFVRAKYASKTACCCSENFGFPKLFRSWSCKKYYTSVFNCFFVFFLLWWNQLDIWTSESFSVWERWSFSSWLGYWVLLYTSTRASFCIWVNFALLRIPYIARTSVTFRGKIKKNRSRVFLLIFLTSIVKPVTNLSFCQI